MPDSQEPLNRVAPGPYIPTCIVGLVERVHAHAVRGRGVHEIATTDINADVRSTSRVRLEKHEIAGKQATLRNRMSDRELGVGGSRKFNAVSMKNRLHEPRAVDAAQ